MNGVSSLHALQSFTTTNTLLTYINLVMKTTSLASVNCMMIEQCSFACHFLTEEMKKSGGITTQKWSFKCENFTLAFLTISTQVRQRKNFKLKICRSMQRWFRYERLLFALANIERILISYHYDTIPSNIGKSRSYPQRLLNMKIYCSKRFSFNQCTVCDIICNHYIDSSNRG